jgi:hypothetical protein
MRKAIEGICEMAKYETEIEVQLWGLDADDDDFFFQ